MLLLKQKYQIGLFYFCGVLLLLLLLLLLFFVVITKIILLLKQKYQIALFYFCVYNKALHPFPLHKSIFII